MRDVVSAFCARIGADRLLVQGAGGNVSWKSDADELWIKASGAWLRDALARDIFVRVARSPLQRALAGGNYDVAPQAMDPGALKPSIETTLHALMPWRVVVHVHAVEALALLVRVDGRATIDARMLDAPWQHVHVAYFKPGARLAAAVASELRRRPQARVVFLANHGIVLAADSVEETEAMLAELSRRLASAIAFEPTADRITAPRHIELPDGSRLHRLEGCPPLHELALNAALFRRVREDWALNPDHVVFLGARATAHADVQAARAACRDGNIASAGVHIIAEAGVYVCESLNEAMAAQLLCFRDVVVRQPPEQRLQQLSAAEVAALLNWDAEQYRRQLSKLA